MDLSFSYVLSQIFVILYYLIYSSTYQLKDNKKILGYGIIATILSAISYMLLGAYTGMFMCLIAIIRNLIFQKENKNLISFIFIIILTLLFLIMTFDSWFCLFNGLATLLYTYALWQKDTKVYKFLGIIVNLLMVIYNGYIKSILGFIFILISLISSITGYFKEEK